MNAVFFLAVAFGAIILVGTILTALHDLVAHAVARERARPAPMTTTPKPLRIVWRHQSAQLDGGATPSARSKMYATAASNPAGRVSRWRAPGMLR